MPSGPERLLPRAETRAQAAQPAARPAAQPRFGTKMQPLVDAVVFGLDDTLITHSYGASYGALMLPRLRDADIPDFLRELRGDGLKLFIASGYFPATKPGQDNPGLVRLLAEKEFLPQESVADGNGWKTAYVLNDPNGPKDPEDSGEMIILPSATCPEGATAQKRILMEELGIDPYLFEAIFSFPYERNGTMDAYASSKREIFARVRDMGFAGDRMLVVSDKEIERRAAEGLGMRFVRVERATDQVLGAIEGSEPDLALREILSHHLYGK